MDWRELEAERVASGVVIHRPTWRCAHGLRESLAPQNAHPAPAPLWKQPQHPWGWIAHHQSNVSGEALTHGLGVAV